MSWRIESLKSSNYNFTLALTPTNSAQENPSWTIYARECYVMIVRNWGLWVNFFLFCFSFYMCIKFISYFFCVLLLFEQSKTIIFNYASTGYFIASGVCMSTKFERWDEPQQPKKNKKMMNSRSKLERSSLNFIEKTRKKIYFSFPFLSLVVFSKYNFSYS